MTTTDTITAINPATGKPIAEYDSDEGRVDAALDRSVEAYRDWRRQPFHARAAVVAAAGRILRERQEEYARLITSEMGKPIREARSEVEKCAVACDYFAEEGERLLAPEMAITDANESFVRFDPLGTVLAVMPWNFPFWQVFRFAAPALMAGNAGILKHASNVPGCSQAIEGVFREAGAPDGIFQSLLISAGTATSMVADDRIAAVTLTGSEAAGSAIGAAAGQAIKPSVLELGGSDPFIILADADLDAAVEHAVRARVINSGQSCIAAKRFIVEAPVYDRVVEGMRQHMEALAVGDPTSEDTDVGPLARRDLVEDLADQLERSVREGARIASGGKALDGPGCFFQPTLLADSRPDQTAMREETFGPLAAVVRVADEAEAIRVANDSRFGLGAAIFTDPERGKRLAPEIEAGHVAVNGIVKSDPRLPFGGIKKSGYGRELAAPGIRSFVNTKTVWIA
ncbi:MAG: NAD-dependent succinate-semialdehyde dehydrogenase [Dehalococcoidia bacterium]|nr:NAD-dependent succinate-semialdehyde dehydrogenase [Dehalococcoidia bacterium]